MTKVFCILFALSAFLTSPAGASGSSESSASESLCLREMTSASPDAIMVNRCLSLCNKFEDEPRETQNWVWRISLLPSALLKNEIFVPLTRLLAAKSELSEADKLSPSELQDVSQKLNEAFLRSHRNLLQELTDDETQIKNLQQEIKDSNQQKDKIENDLNATNNTSRGFVENKVSVAAKKKIHDLEQKVTAFKDEIATRQKSVASHTKELIEFVFFFAGLAEKNKSMSFRTLMNPDLSVEKILIEQTNSKRQLHIYVQLWKSRFILTADLKTAQMDRVYIVNRGQVQLACDSSNTSLVIREAKIKPLDGMLLPPLFAADDLDILKKCLDGIQHYTMGVKECEKALGPEWYRLAKEWALKAKQSVVDLVRNQNPQSMKEAMELYGRARAAQEALMKADPRISAIIQFMGVSKITKDQEMSTLTYQDLLLVEVMAFRYRQDNNSPLYDKEGRMNDFYNLDTDKMDDYYKAHKDEVLEGYRDYLIQHAADEPDVPTDEAKFQDWLQQRMKYKNDNINKFIWEHDYTSG